MKYIAIEGVIGAGKTTVAKKLAEHRGSRLLLERYEENPFLKDFYKDKERNAFPVEMFFLADRIKHLDGYFNDEDLFVHETIADFSFFKSLLFAKVNLNELEFKLYDQFFQLASKRIQQPDLVLFLNRSTSELRKNIIKRGREYEQLIQDDYLIQLKEIYIRFLNHQYDGNVLVYNVGESDFLNNESEFIKLVSAINLAF